MRKRRFGLYFAGLIFLLFSVSPSVSQLDLTVKDLVEKNIQAVGGKEKLAAVKYFSFQAGSSTFFLSSAGQMKITEGKEPVITEVILVDEEKAQRNCFNDLSEYEGLEKATFLTMAKLRSGLFTLTRFEDQLQFQGSKTFGPKNLYLLTSRIDALEIEFYLDSEEFTLQRLVMKGMNTAGEKHEANHDFGPYQEVEGIKIPSSWFQSQVGARGQLFEITDVRINPSLSKDFFTTLELNVGKVGISEGALSGNIVEFSFQRGMLVVGTNWTEKCMQKAGLKAKEKLILKISDQEFEIDFFDSPPSRDAVSPGAKLMFPNLRGENYLIYLWSQEFQELAEKLEPLLPIQVKRK